MFDYTQIMNRIIEETGLDSKAELDRQIGANKNLAYVQEDRGITRSYWEMIWARFPTIDMNYIIFGRRSKTVKDNSDALEKLMSHTIDDPDKREKLLQEYKNAYRLSNTGECSQEELMEAIIRFLIRLIRLGSEKT